MSRMLGRVWSIYRECKPAGISPRQPFFAEQVSNRRFRGYEMRSKAYTMRALKQTKTATFRFFVTCIFHKTIIGVTITMSSVMMFVMVR
jgi:hypothetical protein